MASLRRSQCRTVATGSTTSREAHGGPECEWLIATWPTPDDSGSSSIRSTQRRACLRAKRQRGRARPASSAAFVDPWTARRPRGRSGRPQQTSRRPVVDRSSTRVRRSETALPSTFAGPTGRAILLLRRDERQHRRHLATMLVLPHERTVGGHCCIALAIQQPAGRRSRREQAQRATDHRRCQRSRSAERGTDSRRSSVRRTNVGRAASKRPPTTRGHWLSNADPRKRPDQLSAAIEPSAQSRHRDDEPAGS